MGTPVKARIRRKPFPRGAGRERTRDVVRLWRMSTFDIVVTNQAREENG